MSNPTNTVIDAFVKRVRANYMVIYGDMRSELRTALEIVEEHKLRASSD